MELELQPHELYVLKTLVTLEMEKRSSVAGVNLARIYGKLNVLWGEARKKERELKKLKGDS